MQRIIASFLLMISMVGCASEGQTAERSKVHTAAIEGPDLIVSRPTVSMDGDVMIVSGTVQRKPGHDAPIKGHLMMWVNGKDGKLLDQMELTWSPREIPTNGDRKATYQARYAWTPPAGAMVRISYIRRGEIFVAPGGNGSLPGDASLYTQTPLQPTQPLASPQQPTTPLGGGRL